MSAAAKRVVNDDAAEAIAGASGDKSRRASDESVVC
jgi:hypothetical protein